jgi:hypothetical protein
VAENANISSAVHPAWRTAKNHVNIDQTIVSKARTITNSLQVIIANLWQDSASLQELNAVREKFKTQ